MKNIFNNNEEEVEASKPLPKVGEVTNADLCPRCWNRLSLYETETGDFKWWCYACNTAMMGYRK